MRTGELTEEQIRGLLRGGVDYDLRRELQEELSWRQHLGRHAARRQVHRSGICEGLPRRARRRRPQALEQGNQ